jgi:hypothetical protein
MKKQLSLLLLLVITSTTIHSMERDEPHTRTSGRRRTPRPEHMMNDSRLTDEERLDAKKAFALKLVTHIDSITTELTEKSELGTADLAWLQTTKDTFPSILNNALTNLFSDIGTIASLEGARHFAATQKNVLFPAVFEFPTSEITQTDLDILVQLRENGKALVAHPNRFN